MLIKNKGITLITLVITIIILLIIAGVVVATLTSDDRNLIKRTKDTKGFIEEGQEKGIIEAVLIEVENKFFSSTDAKREYIEDALTSEGIENFTILNDHISISDRTYYYTDILPGFSGL